jgi:hypothetical protein
MRETDLYEPVRDWLAAAGWMCRGEVKGCDIAALNGDRLVIVELKTVLNFDVVLQAADRQRAGDIVYIAVPAKLRTLPGKRWKLILHLLRRLELGLLLVHFSIRSDGIGPRVEEVVPPVPFDRTQSRNAAKKRRETLMKEFHGRTGDRNRGGSVRRTILTSYREQALFIAGLLGEHGALSTRALRLKGTDVSRTTAILADNYYGWFERVSVGIYRLTDKGNKALEDFSSGLEL